MAQRMKPIFFCEQSRSWKTQALIMRVRGPQEELFFSDHDGDDYPVSASEVTLCT